MIQAVLLFLLLVAILGIGGKWLRLPPRRGRPEIESAVRCPTCRSYVVGHQPCARPDCPHRRAA